MKSKMAIALCSLNIIALSSVAIQLTSCFTSEIKLKSEVVEPLDDDVIKVAVIDTGINPALKNAGFMCPTGHKDLTGNGLDDTMGHGSHISGIIDQYAKGLVLSPLTEGRYATADKLAALKKKKIKYCQIIIKYYDKNEDLLNAARTVEAFEYAIKLHVNIINYSGGGYSIVPAEVAAVKKALDAHITVVAAAGNEHRSLDIFSYYPAMDDPRVIVVGNDNADRSPADTSNYGKRVTLWEVGQDVISYGVDGANMYYISGTSQATAIATGKLVNHILASTKVK